MAFSGLDVILTPGDTPSANGPALTVLFHWKLDRATYAMSVTLPGGDHGGAVALLARGGAAGVTVPVRAGAGGRRLGASGATWCAVLR